MSDLGASEFLGYALAFDQSMAKTREACRSEWPSSLGMLAHANTAAMACIGSILVRPDRAYPGADLDAKLRRATIHTALLQGIHAVEYCISHGIYVQAAALVRTEIEGVGALLEVRKGRRIDGRTPNIFPLRHLGRTYGQLSALAHLSKHDLLAHVSNPQVGNIDHTFNAEFARHLVGTHLCTVAALALDLSDFRPVSDKERLSEAENGYLSSAFGILVAEGFLTLESGSD